MRFGFFRDRLCNIRVDNVKGYEANPTTFTPSAPRTFTAEELVTKLNISKKAAYLLTDGGTLTLTEKQVLEKLKEKENETYEISNKNGDSKLDSFKNSYLLKKIDELNGQFGNIKVQKGNLIWEEVGATKSSEGVYLSGDTATTPSSNNSVTTKGSDANSKKIDNDLLGLRKVFETQDSNKIQTAMGEYVLAPLQGKDLKNLTSEQEKKLVEDVFNRGNAVGDQIVKFIGSGDLRAKTLEDLTNNLTTTVVNNHFEKLPSFNGKNDNEEILAKKFGLVNNITNSDFIYEKITYKDLTSKEGGYVTAPRADEITKYNPFVKITESEKVPSDLQALLSKFFPTVDPKSFETINIVNDPSMSFRGSNIRTEGGSNIPLINPKNIAKVAQDQGITDPSHIELIQNGIIANELAHSAMGKLFGDLTPDKSFFGKYSDTFYHSMNNQQFNELISDVLTAQANPRDAIISALKTDEPRYEYTDKTAKRYLKEKGFTEQEIKNIESAKDNQRQSLLESLAKEKGLEIDDLSNGFRDHLLELGNNLIQHAQTQNTKK
jgi:hypothetical protein